MENDIQYQELSDEELEGVVGGAQLNVHQTNTATIHQHATAKGFAALALNIGVAVPINVAVIAPVNVNAPVNVRIG